MAPLLSPQRLIGLGAALFLITIFSFLSAMPLRTHKESEQLAAPHACPDNDPNVGQGHAGFGNDIFKLYQPIRHPLTNKVYVDQTGREFNLLDQPTWVEPLGKKVLILDIDTRIPDNDNELWNPKTMDYEKLDASQGGQMVSAAFMNHFLYSQIHGYDYRFFAAKHLEKLHDTWVKPIVMMQLLHSYQFVVFIDADATIQHLELPLEWLFNKWHITPNTTLAMPLDTEQILNGDPKASSDSKGKVVLNTGVVVAQASPLTFETMKAWRHCPEGQQYPDCKTWAQNWSHEQRAFSEYIRYDYNPNNNIVEIPCDDAMGFPGIVENNPHILSNCTGQFIRHHTIGKEHTKTSSGNALMQSMAELMQKELLKNKEEYWISEESPSYFLAKFEHQDDWDPTTAAVDNPSA